MEKLPKAIAAYIKAANHKDSALFMETFTKDAVFFDDGKSYSGSEEIQKWKEAFDQQFTLNNELVDFIKESENQYVVNIKVSGNFPGSPQIFKHLIALADHKIKEMKVI